MLFLLLSFPAHLGRPSNLMLWRLPRPSRPSLPSDPLVVRSPLPSCPLRHRIAKGDFLAVPERALVVAIIRLVYRLLRTHPSAQLRPYGDNSPNVSRPRQSHSSDAPLLKVYIFHPQILYPHQLHLPCHWLRALHKMAGERVVPLLKTRLVPHQLLQVRTRNRLC